MSNSSSFLPASRVADYFFVAGLDDANIIPTFENAKKYQQLSDNDNHYYQQQEMAINGTKTTATRPRPQGVTSDPTFLKSFPKEEASNSLLGVLDHVQTVIDNFDKERDMARDNVIAVHDTDKYKRSESDKTIKVHRSNTRKWRSPSESKSEHKKSAASNIDQADKKIPNILELKFTPTVLMRYPSTSYSEHEPFPAYAAMFCFPRDISLIYGDSPPPEKSHSFAMTDENGGTVYGSCVTFYEKLPSELHQAVNQAIQEWVAVNMPTSTIEYAQHLKGKIDAEMAAAEEAKRETMGGRQSLEDQVRSCQENMDLYRELLEPVKMAVCNAECIWVPKSIGLLGRMPWIDLYDDWLRIVLDNVVGVGGYRHDRPTIDIESAIVNLIDEVPLPPPGRFEIGLTINSRPLFFSRPPINQVPILKNFSLYPLFRALSPHLILVILETLLAEGKVIFLSQYPSMLSLACESFRYLLFPFYWQFVYIPVLPERLLTCLQAPVPYLVGFQGTMEDLGDHVPEDACIVNIDSNTIHQSLRVMPLPERQRRKLQSALEQYAPLHTRYKIPYGVPLPVQNTFPKGKLILHCSRSRTTDVYVSPARLPRDSESSDTTSIWSNPASLISNSLGLSSNVSTRSSNESSGTSYESKEDPTPSLPQFPGSAFFSTNYNSSTTSLQSTLTGPIRPSLSSSSNKSPHQRVSMPITAATPSSNGHNSYRKANQRRSEPPKGADNLFSLNQTTDSQDTSKNRLSTFMSKPMAVFQHDTGHSSPHMPTPSLQKVNEFDPHYYNYMPRRIKHIEGHMMAEIFTAELNRFQGYRCVCGRQVTEEQQGERKAQMFMCCQECKLVTHDTCTDQILHPCLPSCFDEQKIHNAFIRMFASLLYNYRTGFVDHLDNHATAITASNTTSSGRVQPLYFSKEKFLKHSDKDTREFLSHLSNSQMFTQFITDRLLKPEQDPEILVFDEYIKLKLNRSRLKLVKDDTPFLNDDSFRVSQIIWATPPVNDIGEKKYKRFPTNIQFKK